MGQLSVTLTSNDMEGTDRAESQLTISSSSEHHVPLRSKTYIHSSTRIHLILTSCPSFKEATVQ